MVEKENTVFKKVDNHKYFRKTPSRNRKSEGYYSLIFNLMKYHINRDNVRPLILHERIARCA